MEKETPQGRGVASKAHDEKRRYILLAVISILHERGNGEGEKERTREVQPSVYACGNYASPDGNVDVRARPARAAGAPYTYSN